MCIRSERRMLAICKALAAHSRTVSFSSSELLYCVDDDELDGIAEDGHDV